ncbi:MAG: squalene synthase HpnC [Lautropia sp.]
MNPPAAAPPAVRSAVPGAAASLASPAAAPQSAPGQAAPWHGVDHYENFPVGSWLLPRPLRPAVFAIYRFARHADDLADEGDDPAPLRHARLDALHRALERADGPAAATEPPLPPVVAALTGPVARHRLGWRHFHDLLDAFQQDLAVRRYDDAAAVDDYCARSANPVGRLMLELFEAATPANLAAADAICSALQRINFVQDVAIDRAKDRIYLPLATLRAAGTGAEQFYAEIDAGRLSAASRRAVAIEAARARTQLLAGRPLLARVPRRLGWELRFIVAGGLRILDRLAAADHDPVAARPKLGWRDGAALLALALRLQSLPPPATRSAPRRPEPPR